MLAHLTRTLCALTQKGFVVLPKRWIVDITQPHYP